MNTLLHSHIRTAGLCLVVLAGSAQTVRAGSPASWAPQDTILLVEVPNYQQLHDQFEKTLIRQATQSEQVKQLYKPIFDAIDKGLGDYAGKLGLSDSKELKLCPTGAVALIVTADPPAAPGGEPDFHLAVVGEWGDSAAKMNELLAKVTSIAVERGGKKETSDFRSVPITSIDLVEPQAPAGEGNPADTAAPMMPMGPMGMNPQDMFIHLIKDLPLPKDLSYARADNTFVIGGDAAVVKEVLRRVQSGDADSLIKNEDYQALQRHCAPAGQINAFLNIPRLVELGTMSASTDESRRTIQALGLGSLRSLVMTAALKPKNGAEYEVRGFLPVQGDHRGIVKMLTDQVTNKAVAPDRDFPDSTVACGWMQFQFETLINEVYQIVKDIDPQSGEQFKANLMIPTPDGQIVSLGDILSSFTMPFKGHLAMTPPYGRENVSFVVSFGHKSREQVGRLFSYIGVYFQKREFMGESIYDFAMMPGVGVSVALTDHALLLGNTPGVEQTIRSAGGTQGGALASDRQFQRTATLAPKEAWLVLYQDGIRQFQASLALRQQAKAAAEAGDSQAPAFGFDMTDNILNGMKQPILQIDNPEELRKYQLSTLMTVTNTPKGLQFYMNAVAAQGN